MEAILDFITQNWTFLLILVGSVLVILTVYMLFNIRPSEARTGEVETKSVVPNRPVETEANPSIPTQAPIVKNGEILQTLILPPAPIANDPSIIPTTEPNPAPAQTPTVLPTVPPIVQLSSSKDDPAPAPKPKKPLGRYHVMFRSADEKWIVKRENAERIIRVLETQKEAISFATIKALTNETTIVIHKKDGKIRKQNYKKSDEA
jgi:hypothetical protein